MKHSINFRQYVNNFTTIHLKKLFGSHNRTIRTKKNILWSFMLKGVSISVSLILIPLTINYVDSSQYGIWITISSIVGWFSFFDVGLTNGLRNKLAEAIVNNDSNLAQVYVSTTYAVLSIIFGVVWLIFLICNSFLNWAEILKVPEFMRGEVSVLFVIVFSYFCLQFILRIVTTVLLANQQTAKASLIDVLGNLLSLLIIFTLVKTTKGSLIKLGIGLSIAPLIVLTAANILLFTKTYKKYRPILAKIRFSEAKSLFNLGLVFFIIQIAGIIQFESANIIIARNFNTSEVTSYNIVYKYFGILIMIFTIFLAPFWSASTEAFLKKDLEWIKNSIKKYNQLNIALTAIGCVMLIFSSRIFDLWIGKNAANIGPALSVWACIFFNVLMFGAKYVTFLNSINALRLQLWACVISPFLYVAVALILVKWYHLGVYSLFIASIVSNFNSFMLAPLQYSLIMKGNKSKIWLQ